MIKDHKEIARHSKRTDKRHIWKIVAECTVSKMDGGASEAEVTGACYAFALQNDLDSLQKWCDDWLTLFHSEKCEVLRVTKKRKPLESTYTIRDHSLAEVSNKKYLGIILQKNLSWNDQAQKVCSEANSMLGLLRNNMSSCPRDVKDACYKMLVRPILIYSCIVWDPHTSKNVNNLEMVQRRSARFVFSNYRRTASPSDMIKTLRWESLAERRKKSKIIMIYL